MSAAPWAKSDRFDPACLPIADRHYNRQKPGTNQFAPPGRLLVLLAPGPALWATSWPYKRFTKHEWAGAWVNSLFRREGGDMRASDLIRAAVAATRWHWPEPPALGMVTFIDPDKVRHKRDPGRCYLKAGFHHAGYTKSGLRCLQLDPPDMPDAAAPVNAPESLFAFAAPLPHPEEGPQHE